MTSLVDEGTYSSINHVTYSTVGKSGYCVHVQWMKAQFHKSMTLMSLYKCTLYYCVFTVKMYLCMCMCFCVCVCVGGGRGGGELPQVT